MKTKDVEANRAIKNIRGTRQKSRLVTTYKRPVKTRGDWPSSSGHDTLSFLCASEILCWNYAKGFWFRVHEGCWFVLFPCCLWLEDRHSIGRIWWGEKYSLSVLWKVWRTIGVISNLNIWQVFTVKTYESRAFFVRGFLIITSKFFIDKSG